MHGAWLPLFIALWLVVLFLTVLVLGLIRRITALEHATAERSRHASPGLIVGIRPPTVPGHERLLTPAAKSRCRALVFLNSGSQAAGGFVQDLKRNASAISAPPSRHVELVLVLDKADPDEFGRLAAFAPVVENGGPVFEAWHIRETPFAVVADENEAIRAAAFVPDVASLLSLCRPLAPALHSERSDARKWEPAPDRGVHLLPVDR